tara:strand:- start:225 stop:353 length:129 start_codon:yes stop_codon:yes gene_type:complete
MIEEREGKQLLTFTQQKTDSKVIIPFLKEARQIVDKRRGEFP